MYNAKPAEYAQIGILIIRHMCDICIFVYTCMYTSLNHNLDKYVHCTSKKRNDPHYKTLIERTLNKTN